MSECHALLLATGQNIWLMIIAVVILITGSLVILTRKQKLLNIIVAGFCLSLIVSIVPRSVFADNCLSAAAHPDTSTGRQGVAQTFSVLANDSPTSGAHFVLSSLRLKLTPSPVAGSTVSPDAKSMQAPGEGGYVANDDGTITFTPESSFVGTARGVAYTIDDTAGNTASSTYIPTVTTSVAACSDPSKETRELPTTTFGLSSYYDENYSIPAGTVMTMPFEADSYSVSEAVAKDSNRLVAVVYDPTHSADTVYISTDQAASWQQPAVTESTINGRGSLRVSDDGSTAGIGTSVYDLHTGHATNTGAPWWSGFTENRLSADGSTIVRWDSSTPSPYYPQISLDRGASWTNMSDPSGLNPVPSSHYIRGMAVSHDGNTILAAEEFYDSASSQTMRGVYRSQDHGQTWQRITPEHLFIDSGSTNLDMTGGMMASSDATSIVVSGSDRNNNQSVIVSTHDGGMTWQTTRLSSSISPRYLLDASSDGLQLAAAGASYQLSNDGGLTWTSVPGNGPFSPDSINATGSVMTAHPIINMYEPAKIGISTDHGLTWQSSVIVQPQFVPTDIDFDPNTPGIQTSFADPSNGWSVQYDPTTNDVTVTVTDSEAFDRAVSDGPNSWPHFTVASPVGCAQPPASWLWFASNGG